MFDAYAFRNWWYICVFTDSFSIFLACVRVYCILYNLLFLFYYLTFQETIKNQLKGNYGGMLFNATCNNSPVISWQSVLLVDETGAPGETHQATSHWQTLSHNVVPSTPHMSGIGTRCELVVIGTDCIGSCKSNYHAFTTTKSTEIRPHVHMVIIKGWQKSNKVIHQD